MRKVFKSLLFLCVLLAAVYAATPWWLPHIVARQLPAGWQLDHLRSSYPTVSGIDIQSLGVSGEQLATGIQLNAAGMRIGFRDMKTEISSLSVDLSSQQAADPEQALTLDDLSIPILQAFGNPPELSVNQLAMTFRNGAVTVVVLDFEAFELQQTTGGYQLVSGISVAGQPELNGKAEVVVTDHSLTAGLRFPAAPEKPAWLAINLDQTSGAPGTKTQIEATFDTDQANRPWLDSVLSLGTAGALDHVSGKLHMRADFAGTIRQDIETLSVASDDLGLVTGEDRLILDFDLLAVREGEQVNVSLARSADIQFETDTGRIDNLLAELLPGYQRQRGISTATLGTELGANSRFVLQPATNRSIEFVGDVTLDFSAQDETATAQSNDLKVEFEDYLEPGLMTMTGRADLRWSNTVAFSASYDDIHLQADELSLATALSLGKDRFVAAGSGALSGARIAPFGVSADRIDLDWRELDLLALAGELNTRTQGFAAEIEAETWSGFDFDVAYQLDANADVNGQGNLMIDAGPSLPMAFDGNAQTGFWDVTFPETTIELADLDSLARTAQVEMPPSIGFSEGIIKMHAGVVVRDDITATVVVNGNEIGVKMQESMASGGHFALDARYGTTLSVTGPVSLDSVALAGGLEVQQIRADLKFAGEDDLGVENLRAELFDGLLSMESLRFVQGRVEETQARLSRIDFERLLEFVDVDGLEGTGTLEMTLPLGSDETGLYVRDGSFNATGPGRLAYSKEGLASTNIGMQALENFHYTDLSGTVNYQPDGSYEIVVRLEGSNPDLYDGHPIVFTLNISGSLPELFEALFITGNFEDAILNQVRSN